MSHRAFKYRFYPTEEQRIILAQTFGCARVVYNKALSLRQESYIKNKEKVSYHATSVALTEWKKQEEFTWLNEVSSVPLQQSLRHLQKAYTNFFAGRAKYPKFKKRGNGQSLEYTRSGFRWDGKFLKIAKCDTPLDIRWSRKFIGEPSTITVSKDPADRYFVSILVEEPIKKLKRLKTSIGIDLGLTDFAVTSDGEKFQSPKSLATNEKKLVKLQRKLSKKKEGSNNRNKARLKVARLHAKISDIRKDFNHKLSTKLVRENQTLYVESLAVKDMMKNRKLSKAISDVGWGQFLTFLSYKSEWYGRELVGINRWFPSSKRCSHCGHTLDELKLNVRRWDCPECGTSHDRDVNAALNIMAVGQAVLAFGENVSLMSNDVSNSR